MILLRVLTTSEASVVCLDENFYKIWSLFSYPPIVYVIPVLLLPVMISLTLVEIINLLSPHTRSWNRATVPPLLLIAIISTSECANRMPLFYFCLVMVPGVAFIFLLHFIVNIFCFRLLSPADQVGVSLLTSPEVQTHLCSPVCRRS